MTGSGPYTFEPCAGGHAPWEVAGHWVAIRGRERTLGGLGVLAGPILETVAQEGQVVWFELDSRNSRHHLSRVKYSAPPDLSRFMARFFPGLGPWQRLRGLEERLERFSHPLVMRREF